MTNDITLTDGNMALGRQIPTPAQMQDWVTEEIIKLVTADAEFTAYTITQRLRNPQDCPRSAGYEISHSDVRYLVHDVVMPQIEQKFAYSSEQRDWFNQNKGVTESALTYLPTKYLTQKLQAQINVAPVAPVVLPAVNTPALPATGTNNQSQTFGFVIDDEE